MGFEFLSKGKIRELYFSSGNRPLVCRVDGCYARIGIYYRDFFSGRALALQAKVSDDECERIAREQVVYCPACTAPYPLSRHGDTPTDEFPSEDTMTLRVLSSYLRREYRKKQRLEAKLSDD